MEIAVRLKEFEYFILILVRVSAFIFAAPFFNMTNVPRKVKAALSALIAILLFSVLDYKPVEYSGVLGYGALVIEEAIVGVLIGFFANVCSTILAFAGQIMDMEIGFSMVNELDPVSKVQTTITSNFYSYCVILIMFITNMHHYILGAFVDAYNVIPIGEAILKPTIYNIMVKFMADYFVIGFRIVLPVFAATLVVNVVLAILAKVAPQMNMFVVGLQLKVLVGLIMLFLIIGLMPAVSDFIFKEMKLMMRMIISGMS